MRKSPPLDAPVRPPQSALLACSLAGKGKAFGEGGKEGRSAGEGNNIHRMAMIFPAPGHADSARGQRAVNCRDAAWTIGNAAHVRHEDRRSF